MSNLEWKTRCELAACYRIADLLGWSDNIFTHFSARIPDEPDAYLINEYGLLFDEITASNLVKVNLQGKKISGGRVNSVALNLHNALHESRSDINCIIHTHTTAGVAVSVDQRGLLPISQQSLTVINSVAYHDYEGVLFWEEERPRLIKDLADKDLMILRNHGLVATATNIPTCFSRMYMLESACRIQCDAVKDPILITDHTINTSLEHSKHGSNSKSTLLMWQAMLRKLEREKIEYRI